MFDGELKTGESFIPIEGSDGVPPGELTIDNTTEMRYYLISTKLKFKTEGGTKNGK
jgi:hypothetical protein